MPLHFLDGTDGSCSHGKERESPEHRAVFEQLYNQRSREVWAFAYAICTDGDIATECMQQAFLDLWNEGLEIGDAAMPWLRKRAQKLATAPATNGKPPVPDHEGNGHAAENPLFPLLRDKLAGLNQHERTLLTLRYALDYDTAQIAAVLGADPTIVHMKLSSLRKRLARSLPGNAED